MEHIPDFDRFEDALQGLENGDFSRLEPLFVSDQTTGRPCQIVRWHAEGFFADHPKALSEALTCACFLGRTDAAEYLLRQGVDPSGGSNTGLNAFHWAVNRGQLEATRLLIRWKAPFEPRSMYGGNVIETAVWSAINEPRGEQLLVIEELLKAGARLEHGEYPTGHEQVDALLHQYRSR
jgi:ankyrin repeat protein